MLEELIRQIEKDGLFWAMEGGPKNGYLAIVEQKDNYVGDGLAGPGASYSETAIEALKMAFEKEKKAR